MIDGDSGDNPRSPYFTGEDKYHEDDYESCDVCQGSYSPDEIINIKLLGEKVCHHCIDDKRNASDLILHYSAGSGGDWSPEDSYEIRREVTVNLTGHRTPTYKEAKQWFTNFNQSLYAKIILKKAEQ